MVPQSHSKVFKQYLTTWLNSLNNIYCSVSIQKKLSTSLSKIVWLMQNWVLWTTKIQTKLCLGETKLIVWKIESFPGLHLSYSLIFFAKHFAYITHFLLNNICKRIFLFLIIFSFWLDLELFAKTKKDLVSTHSQKAGFCIFIM